MIIDFKLRPPIDAFAGLTVFGATQADKDSALLDRLGMRCSTEDGLAAAPAEAGCGEGCGHRH